MSRVHPQNHQRRQGHESRGGRGSTESDGPTALSPGEAKVSAWCGTGEKGGYRDFPPSLRTLPFGRRQVRAASCILELREVACCRVDFPLCVSPPAPTPLTPPPPQQPQRTIHQQRTRGCRTGMPNCFPEGWGWLLPRVTLFGIEPLGLQRLLSHPTNLPHPASDCLHPESIHITIPCSDGP